MRAVLFYAPGDIRYGETPRPEPGPGEVLIKIEVALTCGTDLKTYRRGHPVLIKETPSVFGHEWAGVVAELGPGAEGFSIGQRVTAPNSAPCGRCFYCRRGRLSLCEDLQLLNGAYAEFIAVPERIVEQNLMLIPDHVPFRHAPLTEPLACALHGIERSRIELGDTVCVIGHGPIGLMLTRLAKLKGARVIVVGRNPHKLEKARQFGADELVDITAVSDPVEAVRGLTQAGRGVDVAIEAVGYPETWEQAIAMARPGGLVNLFGGCESGTRIKVDTRRLHYDELEIIGVFHHTPRYARAALALIASAQIDADALITHEMPLENLEQAFHLMTSGGALKVAIAL
ncbi:MAG: zinc-binding dehydrogenase [Anaerolineae bacterium]|nr:zinc-binding dehydrogenase [Anaerolineae bacterium]